MMIGTNIEQTTTIMTSVKPTENIKRKHYDPVILLNGHMFITIAKQ
jgi:hypothetical protein